MAEGTAPEGDDAVSREVLNDQGPREAARWLREGGVRGGDLFRGWRGAGDVDGGEGSASVVAERPARIVEALDRIARPGGAVRALSERQWVAEPVAESQVRPPQATWTGGVREAGDDEDEVVQLGHGSLLRGVPHVAAQLADVVAELLEHGAERAVVVEAVSRVSAGGDPVQRRGRVDRVGPAEHGGEVLIGERVEVPPVQVNERGKGGRRTAVQPEAGKVTVDAHRFRMPDAALSCH